MCTKILFLMCCDIDPNLCRFLGPNVVTTLSVVSVSFGYLSKKRCFNYLFLL